MTPPVLLRFVYRNWRGELHKYVIRPESIEFTSARTSSADSSAVMMHWMLHGFVVTRDEQPRPGRRSFLLSKCLNIEEVEETYE